MADPQVLVQYIDSALAAQNGSQPFPVGLRLAEEYESKGWVKILNRPPQANPSLPINPNEKRFGPLSKMPEEENLTKVAWITSNYIDATTRKVGARLGFQVEQFSSTQFSAGHLMQAKLMIVESNIKGFTGAQLENMRCIQFQKRIPFIFRIVGYDNSQYFQQNLIHSKLNIFATTQLFDYVSDLHDKFLGDWFIEDKGDYHKFWRKVDGVLKPPSPEPLIVVEEAQPIAREVFDQAETLLAGAAYTTNQMKIMDEIVLESTELVADHNIDLDKMNAEAIAKKAKRTAKKAKRVVKKS